MWQNEQYVLLTKCITKLTLFQMLNPTNNIYKKSFFELTGCDVIFEEIGSFFGFKVTDKCIRQKK